MAATHSGTTEAAGPPSVTAVILAWQDEPILEEAVVSALASEGVWLDVVLVDNGCTNPALARLAALDRVTALTPGTNTGFAVGCNLGARAATGEYLVFLNGDAVVRPTAVARLVHALGDDVGLSTSSLRLYDDPELLNSAGNPVHFAGLSWSGGFGDRATLHARSGEVASASGAATAVRADRYDALGGFCEPMFAYCEDTELSLRCWQRGWRVVYVADAVVLHRYEFSRNTQKLYLLERNRLFLLLTLYQRRTLAVLAPALVALEMAVLVLAVRQGWVRQKVAGWTWLWRHRDLVRARRRTVQAARTRSDARVARVLTGDFAPGDGAGTQAPALFRAGSRAYWSVARRFLGETETASIDTEGSPELR